MCINLTELTEQFKNAGLKRGDYVLIHSSLKSLGYVDGGADTVIKSIMGAVGDEGTLIVPTLTGRKEDSAANPPVFDVLKTPCWTGIIPETVRNMKGAMRSLNPTHSAAAIGSGKEYITSGHEYSKSPCDNKSPYYKNALKHGYVMLIGVDQESNTSIHSCEESANVPYHLHKEELKMHITGYNGEDIVVSNRLHNWEKPATDFNKLDSLLKDKGIMNIYKIGNAKVRIINAYDMFNFTIDLLREDPLFLLISKESYT